MIRRWLRHGLIAATILIYALLEHYTNTSAGSSELGAALAVMPLLLAGLLLARRSSHPVINVSLACVLAGGVLFAFWPQIERKFGLMYLLQQVGVYLILGFGFGRSLMAGQVPLCTQWASIVHGTLAEPVQHYTRAVTLAWMFYFISIAAFSALLYAVAPTWIWSLFSNFLTLPLAALMFAVEYEVRRRRLPWMRRATLADTARAYFATGGGGAAPRL